MTMRLCAIALALMALTGCSSVATWTEDDTRREWLYQAVNIVDAAQTAQIQHEPNIEEVWPLTRDILGAEPSTRDTVVYFATLGLSHYLIARALPPKARRWWQRGTGTIQLATVASNCSIGLIC